jgi:hypothetical protein
VSHCAVLLHCLEFCVKNVDGNLGHQNTSTTNNVTSSAKTLELGTWHVSYINLWEKNQCFEAPTTFARKLEGIILFTSYGSLSLIGQTF